MKPKASLLILLVTLCLLPMFAANGADWQPVAGTLKTRWAKDVSPKTAWPEYPRPGFERKNWKDLNGLWDYTVTPKDAGTPTAWTGKILMPFCIESALSGVGRELQPDEALWYHRAIDIKPKEGDRELLNFEAVDYQATVWVNGKQVGEHSGGHTAFSFDITDTLKKGGNEIVMRVWDGTGGTQLRGKQTLKPGGIWYTRVSGIWQTVWLEEVPAAHLADVKITTAINPAAITLVPQVEGAANANVRVTASFKGRKVASASGAGEIKLPIPDAKLWSPAHPNLYDLRIELLDAKGKVIDTVKSYAGIREVGRKKDAQGNWRFTLNGEEIFHWGPLDQGWWPDGLLTPPSEAAMRGDIDFLKAAGFNMIRKHIKVEPRRYYAYCDRVGMMIWQDQVSASGGKLLSGQEMNPRWTRMAPNPVDAPWSDEEHAQWQTELQRMIDQLHNEPCIVVWTPFNEAWGQHRSVEIAKWIGAYDPTRLVNVASGGNFWHAGDIADSHRYPDPGFPLDQERFNDYVKVVGEFGGHGWPTEGHLWRPSKKNWGYGGLPKTKEEYIGRFQKSLNMLADLKAKGICAGVYTQTTDVEDEINGLMTYDRAVQKIPADELNKMSRELGPEILR